MNIILFTHYTLYKLSGVVTERGEKVLKTRPKTQGFMVVTTAPVNPRVGSLSREFLSRRKTHDGTVSRVESIDGNDS